MIPIVEKVPHLFVDGQIRYVTEKTRTQRRRRRRRRRKEEGKRGVGNKESKVEQETDELDLEG